MKRTTVLIVGLIAFTPPALADHSPASQPAKKHQFHFKMPAINVDVPDVDIDLDMDIDGMGKGVHWCGTSGLCSGAMQAGTPAATGGDGKPAAVAAKAPVHFVIEVQSADVKIAAGGDKVSVSAHDCGKDEIKLFSTAKDTYEAAFDEEGSCEGPVVVQLPTGSAVDIHEMQGDITTTGVLGDVRIESVSGGIKLDGTGDVDLQAVEGDLTIARASGKVRVQTVNGDSKIATTGSAPDMTFRSTSGSLAWSGACGKGCRLRIEVYSGDVKLAVDPASSFELTFASQSGDLEDKLGLINVETRKNIAGITRAKAQYGKAEGAIAVKMFSGDLTVSKR